VLAPILVPHLRNRPFTLKQHYTVPRGPYRYVKDAPPTLPPVVKRCPQPARSRRGGIVNYALINNRTSILWMVELGAVDLVSYVRTSGGAGLHVLVPIARRHTHEEARAFANVVAGALRLSTAKIDTKMIGHGQQVVAGYSVRPLPYAPVATPLRWDEVTRTLDPREHNLRTVPGRVAELGDLHEPLLHGRQLLEIRTRLRHN
jgi:DNA primase